MSETEFFPASQIAEALGTYKKDIQRRAQREGWPSQAIGNRLEFCPPAEVMALLRGPGAESCTPAAAVMQVSFTAIARDPVQSEKVRTREEAVLLYNLNRPAMGAEKALKFVVGQYYSNKPEFKISVSSLRRWTEQYSTHGLNGLVEQKMGVVGRRGVQVPERFVAMGKAAVAEFGSVARAARHLATHPELPAAMRMHMHEGHSTKSHVTPSIRKAISVAPLTSSLLQGPRAARLASRWTPGDYSQVKAGDMFVSDDMTSNVVCWCEWPNAQGYRLGQVQILPVMDIGTLRWLNVRVIMREGGQYNSDDIWGLFGDTFDKFGLPAQGFLLEGGHWQSKGVQGVRTGLGDDDRIGGLASLGLEVHRSYDPRSKGMLEGSFHRLQSIMDRMPGYVGRDQRTQLPEVTKKRLAIFSAKNPGHHPREFFPHISQLADQVLLAMEEMNHERQEGQILRGASPLEKWAQDGPRLCEIPDEAKWMYRSAMSVVKVTSNGCRVTVGSGAKMLVHYYDNPQLLVPRQGRQVIVHWNDYNPEADACLRDMTTGQFIGLAKYVKPLSRFGATEADLAAEANRKKAGMQYARTEIRTMQADLQRRRLPVPIGADQADMGAQIRQAADEATARDRAKAITARQIRNTPVTAEDLATATEVSDQVEEMPIDLEAPDATPADMTADEISNLFTDAPARGQRPVEVDDDIPF